MESRRKRSDVEILEWILSLDEGEIDIAVPAIMKQYMQLHPDTEMVITNIPKYSWQERQFLLEAMLRYIQHYEEPKP